MNRLPLRIALAAATTLAALFACEAASRFLLPVPRYHREPVELDAELGFRGIPHDTTEIDGDQGRYTIAFDAHGLRGRDLPSEPAPGVSRIVFVGDSMLVGQAVREEQLATSLVESALRRDGREVEVYNLSVIDYGTAQELLLLRRLGQPLAPDTVVLFVYPANDLVNNTIELAGRTTVSPGDPLRPYLVAGSDDALELRYLDPLRARLRRHSRLFATLELRALSAQGDAAPREDWVARVRRGLAPKEDLELFREHPGEDDPWARAWESTFALLRTFRAECDAIGARLLVVVVPSLHQVVRSPKWISLEISARLAGARTLDALLDWDLPERRLRRFFEDEGIEARFLLGPLRDATAAGARVYARDDHLSPTGHQIAAASVLGGLAPDASAAPPPPASEQGGPSWLLPDASAAPSLLDFRSDPHVDHLGGGWEAWTPPGSDAPPGWRIGASAMAVLPRAEGELVLRGSAPVNASLPIDGSLAIAGGPRHRFRIERAGPFALRFAAREPGKPEPPSAEGYFAVMLALQDAAGGEGADSVSIEALGFDRAGARGDDRR